MRISAKNNRFQFFDILLIALEPAALPTRPAVSTFPDHAL
jgi:hypothetical protein